MIATTTLAIQETIERANGRIERLGVTFGELPDGWLRGSDLVNDPDAVRDLLDQVCQLYKMDNARVAASFLVLGYFWYPLAGSLACYLTDRRVPDLSANAVATRPLGGVAFLSPRCWVLPDDPAAGDPEVEVVECVDALRAKLVRQLEQEHVGPLFTTLRSVAPYGLNGMRANYLDRFASAIVWLAEALGDDEIARREVPAFMALASHAKCRTGLIELQHEGKRGVFLRRGGCCLNYKLDGREMCDTCSVRPMEERLEILRLHLTSGTAAR
jgi:hypothetical protein